MDEEEAHNHFDESHPGELGEEGINEDDEENEDEDTLANVEEMQNEEEGEEGYSDALEEFRSLQALWDNDQEPDNLADTLRRMSELVEQEVCEYYKLDPDPFDDRQPDEQNAEYSTSPFGRIMSEIDELYIEKLIDMYILPPSSEREGESRVTLGLTCRLLYNILPASISFTFESDNMRETGSLLEKLISVARETNYEGDSDNLKYYVLALLAQGSSVECPFSNSSNHAPFEQLASSALRQLHKLKEETKREMCARLNENERPFAHLSRSPTRQANHTNVATTTRNILGPVGTSANTTATPMSSKSTSAVAGSSRNQTTPTPGKGSNKRPLSTPGNGQDGSVRKKTRRLSPTNNIEEQLKPTSLTPEESSVVKTSAEAGDNSNSWADVGQFYIGTYSLEPLTITMKQRILLQFLTPLAEYQELLSIFLEEQSLELIDFYLEVNLHKDIRLTFEALRFLSGLLCHRRLAAKFVLNSEGLRGLVSVVRPSVAATAVSMCLFYIACCRDVFERALPQLNPNLLREVCRYGLWLLECCAHESGRCHATMFFAEIFPFRCLLETFDQMDGLRTLHNSITTLEIFNNIIASAAVTSSEYSSHLTTPEGGPSSRRAAVTPPASAGRQQTVTHRTPGHHFNHSVMADSFLLGPETSDDRSDSIRQAIKHYCVALRSYFSMHLAIKADNLKKTLKRTPLYLPLQSHKAADINRRIELKNMWFLLEFASVKANWPVVDQFVKLQGLQVLLQICYMAQEWKSYQFRAETLRNALDVIACITAHPKYQELLCQAIEVPVHQADDDEMASQPSFEQIQGTKIILNLVGGAAVQDAEVQKSALRVIINCACGPYGILYTGLPGDQVLVGMGHPKLTGYPANPRDEIVETMWGSVRNNNGLQVLLSLAVTKTPPADAELLRSLACVALYGLCLDDSIKQIVSRMPLFSQGLLEIAMREPPVQPDKLLDHQKFQHCGSAIIDRVFSTRKYYHPHPSGARSIEELKRAEIVAQTRISWDPKELIALISEHLDFLGYSNSAKTLFHEAELASFYKTHKMKPIVLHPKPRNAARLSVTVGQPGQPMEIVRLPSSQTSLPLRAVSHTSSLTQPQRIMFSNILASSQQSTVEVNRQSEMSNNISTVASRATNSHHSSVTGSPMLWPCRSRNHNFAGSHGDSHAVPSTPETYKSVKRQIQQSRGIVPSVPSPLVVNSVCNSTQNSLSAVVDLNMSLASVANTEDKSLSLPWRASLPNKSRTLNNIVESYLESQHAKCERPIVFCPPFSLKEQHKCPEPLYNTSAPLSVAKRMFLRKVHGGSGWGGGMDGSSSSFNRKLIHSRFRPVMTFSEANIDRGFFTSVSFSKCRSDLFIGTSMGEVRRYSCSTDGQVPMCSFECHDTSIAGIDVTTSSNLLLTTVSWGSPGATLWKLTEDRNSCSKVMDFENEMYCEFSKVNQDLVIGSYNEKAFVYDIASKTRIRSLFHPGYSNNYLMNMATGSYHSNNLVLNDGVLWDTRQPNPLHKFDKFNDSIAGQFHPNTLQVVINSEVWDLRTYKLVQTVPALDQCLVWFNNAHNVIYSSAFTAVDDDRSLTMASCIKTIDACDYQTIATLDTKKKVGDVSIEPRDQYVAVIENGGGNGGVFLHESGICKIYEVGVPREPDQEDEENSDNDDDEDDDDDDDDDDDEDDDDDDEAVIFDELLNHQMQMPPHRGSGSGSNRGNGPSGGASGINAAGYEDEEDDDEEDSDSDSEFDDGDFFEGEFEPAGALVDEDSLGSMNHEDDEDENSPESLLDLDQ